MLGWWFWVTNSNNQLARSRLKVCAGCEFRKWFVCSDCGCVLQAKSRVNEEECPKLKWFGHYIEPITKKIIPLK